MLVLPRSSSVHWQPIISCYPSVLQAPTSSSIALVGGGSRLSYGTYADQIMISSILPPLEFFNVTTVMSLEVKYSDLYNVFQRFLYSKRNSNSCNFSILTVYIYQKITAQNYLNILSKVIVFHDYFNVSLFLFISYLDTLFHLEPLELFHLQMIKCS